jgi:hypothetical protein
MNNNTRAVVVVFRNRILARCSEIRSEAIHRIDIVFYIERRPKSVDRFLIVVTPAAVAPRSRELDNAIRGNDFRGQRKQPPDRREGTVFMRAEGRDDRPRECRRGLLQHDRAHQGCRQLDREESSRPQGHAGSVQSAIEIANGGPLKATGSQRPYDQGVAEATAMMKALIGQTPPARIGVQSLPVVQSNVLGSYKIVFRKDPPPQLADACKKAAPACA